MDNILSACNLSIDQAIINSKSNKQSTNSNFIQSQQRMTISNSILKLKHYSIENLIFESKKQILFFEEKVDFLEAKKKQRFVFDDLLEIDNIAKSMAEFDGNSSRNVQIDQRKQKEDIKEKDFKLLSREFLSYSKIYSFLKIDEEQEARGNTMLLKYSGNNFHQKNSFKFFPQFTKNFKIIDINLKEHLQSFGIDFCEKKISEKTLKIKNFLSHMPIGKIQNVKEYFDALLFCLSKVFNFGKILNSTQFFCDNKSSLNSEKVKTILKKRKFLKNQLSVKKKPTLIILKKLLTRTLAFMHQYSEFKSKLSDIEHIKDADNFPIFNEKIKIKIGPKIKKMDINELIHAFDFKELQDFFMLSTFCMKKKQKNILHQSITLGHENSKQIKINKKNLCKILYIHKKTGSEQVNSIFKIIWREFTFYCIQNKLAVYTKKQLIEKKINKKIDKFLINKRNLRILKTDTNFSAFLKNFNFINSFSKIIWKDNLNYTHLNGVKMKNHDKIGYIKRRFDSYLRFSGKRPWSLSEWIIAFETFNSF